MKREYRSRGQLDLKGGFLFFESRGKLSIFRERKESANKGYVSGIRIKMEFR